MFIAISFNYNNLVAGIIVYIMFSDVIIKLAISSFYCISSSTNKVGEVEITTSLVSLSIS